MTGHEKHPKNQAPRNPCINQNIVDYLTNWRDSNNFNDRLANTVTRAITQIRREHQPILSKSDALRVKYVGDFIACQIEQALRSTVNKILEANGRSEVLKESNGARSSARANNNVSEEKQSIPNQWYLSSSQDLICNREPLHDISTPYVDDRVNVPCIQASSEMRGDNTPSVDQVVSHSRNTSSTSCTRHAQVGYFVGNINQNGDENRDPYQIHRSKIRVSCRENIFEDSTQLPTDNNNGEAPDKQSSSDYIPRPHSGPFALLLALHSAFQRDVLFLTKQELITAASEFTDEPLVFDASTKRSRPSGSRYDGWSSMGSTLIKKGLVNKCSNPAKYSLTLPGLEVARRLWKQHKENNHGPGVGGRPINEGARQPGKRRSNRNDPNLDRVSCLNPEVECLSSVTHKNDSSGTRRKRGPHARSHSNRVKELLTDVGGILIDEGYCESDVLNVIEKMLSSSTNITTDMTVLVDLLRQHLDSLSDCRQKAGEKKIAASAPLENSLVPLPVDHFSVVEVDPVISKKGKKSASPRDRTRKADVSEPTNLWVELTATVACELVWTGLHFESIMSAMQRVIMVEGVLSPEELKSKVLETLQDTEEYLGVPSSQHARDNQVGLSQEGEGLLCGKPRSCGKVSVKRFLEPLGDCISRSPKKATITRYTTDVREEDLQLEVVCLDEESDDTCSDDRVDCQAMISKIAKQTPNRSVLMDQCSGVNGSVIEVVLVIDNRELFGSGRARSKYAKELDLALKRNELKSDSRCLPVGDAIFIARSSEKGEELVLDFIAERKTVHDFVDSWVDGRIVHQVSAMDKSGMKKKMIVLEGDFSDLRSYAISREVCVDKLKQYLNELSICHNYFVHWTRDMSESVATLVAVQRQFIDRFDKEQIDGTNYIGTSFTRWAQDVKATNDVLKLEELFMLQMCAVPGIGTGTASSIVEGGIKTPALMFEVCKKSESNNSASIDSNIEKNKRFFSELPASRSSALRELFTAKSYDLQEDQ